MQSRLFAVIVVVAGALHAGDIVLPSNTLERTGIVPVTYRTNRQVSGQGMLKIRWTDSLGRVVEDRTIPVTLTDESEFTFPLDLRRAVAMHNELSVHFSHRRQKP